MINNAWAHCDTMNGPVIADAKKALISKDVMILMKWVSVDKLVRALTDALEKSLREKFNHVIQTDRQVNKDVASGREFVEAYVQFAHFAEGIHGLIQGGAQHHKHK